MTYRKCAGCGRLIFWSQVFLRIEPVRGSSYGRAGSYCLPCAPNIALELADHGRLSG
jgi:hypothetical protein